MIDFDNLTDDQIAVVRNKCDQSLLFFTGFWFRLLRGSNFITNWHHDDICSSLDDVQNYKLTFLGINIPPRFSKTEIAAVNFIARGIGMNPCGNYLYITASDELRAETSIRIRDIVSHPVFKRMYGVEMKKDQTGKNLWRTSKGGGLKTATIFGQITGFGAGQMVDHSNELEDYIREFEGCIVLDDINKTDDSESLNANNTKVLRVIGNTILSRKNSSDTPIINIQQRAGMEDATAYFNDLFENNPKAKTLVYPIIYNGESLWPWKMPMEEIIALRDSPKTKHTFETQYMQDPSPIEGLMYPDRFKTYKELPTEIDPNGNEILQGWCLGIIDPADGGDDYFSAPMVQVVGNRMYLKDVIFNQVKLIDNEPNISGKTKLNNVKKWVVETNSMGGYLSGRLRVLVPDVTIFGQWNAANKLSRIINMSGFISKYLYVPESPSHEMQVFLKYCYKFLLTSKKEDDAPDSLSIGAAHLEKFYHLFKE